MNAREQRRFDMFKRVGTFGINNAADLITPVPPATKVSDGQTQAKQLFDALSTPVTGLIARIGQNAESQQVGIGTARGGTTSKDVQRHALYLEIKGINRTAAAIAEELKKPEMMSKFRMPHGEGDVILVAKTQAIAEAAQAMASDFVRYEHAPTFVADLLARVDAFSNAETTQETGDQGESGTTLEFGPLLHDGMVKVKQLDAFMHNFYRNNAEKLGEWHTASHVERDANKKEKPDEPPATEPKP